MNFMRNDEDIDHILQIPYIYEKFDKADVEYRLSLLVPENMYVTMQSKIFEKERAANPEAFKKERWYSKHFAIEQMSAQQMENLKKVMPLEGMKLGNAPPNQFMPKLEELVTCKQERKDPDTPGIPVMIAQNDSHELWFKQDDSFDQPFVVIHGKIITNDCNFPLTTESMMYTMLWEKMYSEHIREIQYCAEQAGIDSHMGLANEYIKFNLSGFNVKLETYLEQIISELHDFKTDKAFFDDLVKAKYRSLKNSLLQEPYQSLAGLQKQVLFGDPSTEEIIEEFSEVSYEKFLKFKSQFMRNLKLKWLICGHLDQEKAQKIFSTVKDNVKHKELAEDDLFMYDQMVKLPNQSVTDFVRINPLPEG